MIPTQVIEELRAIKLLAERFPWKLTEEGDPEREALAEIADKVGYLLTTYVVAEVPVSR